MKNRILWIDTLRIIAMFGVIIIHIASNTINTFGLIGLPKNIYETIVHSLYFVIPLFVMISGMLFLDKDISIKDLLKKYIKRIVLVIVVFGSIFSFIELFFNTRTLSLSFIPQIITDLLTGNLWAHMWYLYMILGLYLITPLLRLWIKNSSEKQQLYLLIILFVFSILVPELNSILKTNIAFTVPIASGYLFVYLLGHYLNKKEVTSRGKTVVYLLGLFSFFSIIFIHALNLPDKFITYTSLFSILIASSVFLLFKNKTISENRVVGNIIVNLGTASFGIYVLHQLFINIIYKLLKIELIMSYPYMGLIVYSLGLLLVTFITVYILNKIPFVKRFFF